MSIPKEPRQIMINLMYLVLTAMLALNVSNEILHAFKIINVSIGKSNQSIEGKNQETMMAFDANENMEGHKDRVKPFNDKAKAVRAQAADAYIYLENWKKKIIDASGGTENDDPKEPNKIKREDNIDASTDLLVEQKGGDEIKKKLTTLRDFMLSQLTVDAATKSAIEKDLPLQINEPPKTEDNPSGDWSYGTFHHVPTLAAVTLFAKLQNDVRNSEAVVLQKLFDEAGAQQIKFDAIKPVAVVQNSYVLQGQQVTAQIMVAAYNKSVSPRVSLPGGSIKTEDGIATWTGTANGTGMQTVRGNVSMNLGDREFNQPVQFQYMVGSAGASLQLDKMNVFYIGVQNPVTVTAAGYSLEDVSLSIPGATVTKDANGHYQISVDKPGELTAAINANKSGGGVAQVGGMKVRVKYIPDPEPQVGGKTGSFFMAANVFRAQIGIVASLKNFDFDARYTVISFDFSYLPKKGEYQGPLPVTGPSFSGNPQVAAYMSRAKAGDKIFLENIKAIGPDKRARVLPSLIITLN